MQMQTTNPGRPRHFTERKADDGSLFDSRRQAQAQLAKEGNKKDPASTNLPGQGQARRPMVSLAKKS